MFFESSNQWLLHRSSWFATWDLWEENAKLFFFPSFCNWCNCSFCSKFPARAYILEADCTHQGSWRFTKKKIKKNQQRTSEQNAVCWFRHFILLSVDAARSPPPANSAGAHQRQWNYRESLHAAAMKHSHGEKSLCAKHRYSGIRGLSMLSWRMVIEMVC